ncbi:MAG: hypothetical protein Q9196_004431 [Gyalolechia fulgens]
MAQYIGHYSVKRRMLAKIAADTVEIFVNNLAFKVLAIRSMHSQIERDAAVEKFNDPTDQNSILVTSLRISSTAVNLQYTYYDVVFRFNKEDQNFLDSRIKHYYDLCHVLGGQTKYKKEGERMNNDIESKVRSIFNTIYKPSSSPISLFETNPSLDMLEGFITGPTRNPATERLNLPESDYLEDPDEVQRIEDELEALRGLPDDERSQLEEVRLGEFEAKVDKLVQKRDAHTAASSRQNIRPPDPLLPTLEALTRAYEEMSTAHVQNANVHSSFWCPTWKCGDTIQHCKNQGKLVTVSTLIQWGDESHISLHDWFRGERGNPSTASSVAASLKQNIDRTYNLVSMMNSKYDTYWKTVETMDEELLNLGRKVNMVIEVTTNLESAVKDLQETFGGISRIQVRIGDRLDEFQVAATEEGVTRSKTLDYLLAPGRLSVIIRNPKRNAHTRLLSG